MSIGTDAETKKKIIAEYAVTEGDTGSPRSRSRCSATASPTSPSTSRRTSTTTTAVVVCCCSSVSAAGC